MSSNYKATAILIKTIVLVLYIGICVKLYYYFDELVAVLFFSIWIGSILYALLVYFEKKLRSVFSPYFIFKRKLEKAYKLSLKTNNWRVRQEYYLNLLWLKAIYNKTEKYEFNLFRPGEYIFDKEIIKVKPDEIQVPSKINMDNSIHEEFLRLVDDEFRYDSSDISIDEECLPIPLYKLNEICDNVDSRFFNFDLYVIHAKTDGNKIDNDYKNDIKKNLKYKYRFYVFISSLLSYIVFLLIFFGYLAIIFELLNGGLLLSLFVIAISTGITIYLYYKLSPMFEQKFTLEKIKNRCANHTLNLSNKDIRISTNVIQVTEGENLHVTNKPINIEIRNKELSISGAYTHQYIIEKKEFEFTDNDITKIKSIDDFLEMEISILSGSLKIKFQNPRKNIYSNDYVMYSII